MKHWINFILICFLMVLSQNLKAGEKLGAFNGAIDLCLKLPADQEIAVQKLVDLGWTHKVGNDARKIAFEGLYSNIFTNNHKTDDLDYTYRNAGLIAISTLRNSKVNAFVHDDLTLSILGTNAEKEYCLFTGPKALAEAIEKKFGVTLKETAPYLKTHSFAVDTILVRVQQINIEKFHMIDADIPDEKLGKYRAIEAMALKKTNLYIGGNRWGAKN